MFCVWSSLRCLALCFFSIPLWQNPARPWSLGLHPGHWKLHRPPLIAIQSSASPPQLRSPPPSSLLTPSMVPSIPAPPTSVPEPTRLCLIMTYSLRASLVAQMVKNLPAVWETWVGSLGQDDPLEEEMATHSRILAWETPWTEEPGGLQSRGSQRVGHNWATNTKLPV